MGITWVPLFWRPTHSATLRASSSGAVTTDERYFAYGKQRDTGKVVTDNRFTGQKEDGSDLQYFNARYYDPQTGLFVSPDTIVPDAGNVLAYNRSMYTFGSPLNFRDSNGHEPIHHSNYPCSYTACVRDPLTGGSVSVSNWTPELHDQYYGHDGPEALTMDEVHQVLDLAGVVDPTGVSDGLNAGLYALEGDKTNAGISALAVLPLGDLLKSAKFFDRVADVRKFAMRPFAQNAALNKNIIEQMYRAIDKLPGGLAGAVRRELANPGVLVGGKSHILKGQERLSSLKMILESGEFGGQVLSQEDLDIVRGLHDDLQNALQGK